MHPPHRPKRNESGEKSVSMLVNTFFFFFFGDHLNLGEKNGSNFRFRPKNHSQFWWRPFFFFFFGDHLNLGEKNVWISDFGQKITLNFGEDIRIFEVLCFKSLPTKIFWIRHWLNCNINLILAFFWWSHSHIKLVFQSLVVFIDVSLVMTTNIIRIRAYDKELRVKLRSFTGSTPESGLFYLCPMNTKLLGLSLYLLLQFWIAIYCSISAAISKFLS